MNKSLLALALALSVLPTAALAQDSNAPASPTPEQRQAMRQMWQQFAQREEQLHEQMRAQILSSLTPVHRREVAATIGQLAIAANPDPQAAAKQLDAMLSPGERQRILAAHESFKSQSMQLHEQMRSQMQNAMPPGHPDFMGHGPMNGGPMATNAMMRQPTDAGTVLLMALSPHPMMEMHPGMMHMEGAPPR
jgi:hypothetical protein